MDSVVIPRPVLAAIEAHARREAPEECCGLLVGSGNAIVDAVPVRNTAKDPIRRYEIAPEAYLAVIRECRARSDRTVVGAYHSHPRSAPVPSPTDREMAFEQFVFVIVGPVNGGDEMELRAFVLREEQFVALQVEPA
jgi:desampylase